MQNFFDLRGKRVLITGSSRGIGDTLARGFAAYGAPVILNSPHQEDVAQRVAELSSAEQIVAGFAFDVSDRQAVANAISGIEDEIGPIDVLVKNAGIHRRAPLEQITEDEWKTVINVNLTSAFFVGQAVAKGRIQRKHGEIITISSLNAEGARPTIGNYCASKGGLNALTRSMATEWGRDNIQVNGIGPGYFKTDLTQKLVDDPQFDAWVRQSVPLGRWGEPEELIGTAIYLASAASNYVNGFIIYVDGGWRAAL